jgi:hypothetical protein
MTQEEKDAKKEIVEAIFKMVQHSPCFDPLKNATEEAKRLDATVQAVFDFCDDFLSDYRRTGKLK